MMILKVVVSAHSSAPLYFAGNRDFYGKRSQKEIGGVEKIKIYIFFVLTYLVALVMRILKWAYAPSNFSCYHFTRVGTRFSTRSFLQSPILWIFVPIFAPIQPKNPTKNKYFGSLFHTVILCWFWLELGQKLGEIKNLIIEIFVFQKYIFEPFFPVPS